MKNILYYNTKRIPIIYIYIYIYTKNKSVYFHDETEKIINTIKQKEGKGKRKK
jgi:hypothetical protein